MKSSLRNMRKILKNTAKFLNKIEIYHSTQIEQIMYIYFIQCINFVPNLSFIISTICSISNYCIPVNLNNSYFRDMLPFESLSMLEKNERISRSSNCKYYY